MKFIILFLLIIINQSIKAQNSVTKGPEITFSKVVHDFGIIYQGEKAEYAFIFSNTGDEPLLINEVKSSCGCTVPVWPREPIMPGQSGQILVKYNTNILGKFNRQVSILSNARINIVNLRVTGTVEKSPSEIMPVQQNTNFPVSK